jgi:hypothetical protein
MGALRPVGGMGQRLDVLLRMGADMIEEERARRDAYLRETMMGAGQKPSLETRLDWLEADSTAQRTAILKLDREVKRLRIGGAVVAAVAGFLLGRVFL